MEAQVSARGREAVLWYQEPSFSSVTCCNHTSVIAREVGEASALGSAQPSSQGDQASQVACLSLPHFPNSSLFLKDGCEGERLNISQGLGCCEVAEIRSVGTEDAARLLGRALLPVLHHLNQGSLSVCPDKACLVKRSGRSYPSAPGGGHIPPAAWGRGNFFVVPLFSALIFSSAVWSPARPALCSPWQEVHSSCSSSSSPSPSLSHVGFVS